MSEKLKPCPFCGGKVNAYKDNHDKCGIECPNCRMYFGIQLEMGCELMEGWNFTFDTAESMKEAWNRRADNGKV